MKNSLLFFTGLLLLGINSSLVFAGTDVGNGGDSVESTAGRRLLDLQELDDLTYFNYDIRHYDSVVSDVYADEILGCLLSEKSLCDLRLFVPAQFGGTDTGLDSLFAMTVAACGGNQDATNRAESLIYPVKPLRWAFTQAELEDVKDEGVVRISNPQTKRQVAVQTGGLVVINRPEFERMDNESKAALKIHESVICAVKAMKPKVIETQGTAPIRAFVRTLISYGRSHGAPEGTPASAVRAASEGLFEHPRRSFTGVWHSVQDAVTRITCDYSLQSGTNQIPNVIAYCENVSVSGYKDRIQPGEVLYNMHFRLSLSREATIVAEVHEGSPFMDDWRKEMAPIAQAGVRRNLRALLNSWSEYVQQSNVE